MAETIAMGGVKREVFDLLLEPVVNTYNQKGYFGFSQMFPDSSSYRSIVEPVLKSRYLMLSDEDIVSMSNVFFIFIDGYLRNYSRISRFASIDDFTKSDIFRGVMKNGVNNALGLFEEKVLNGN